MTYRISSSARNSRTWYSDTRSSRRYSGVPITIVPPGVDTARFRPLAHLPPSCGSRNPS